MTRKIRVLLFTLGLTMAGFALGVVALGGGGALGLLVRPSAIAGALLGLEAAAGGALGAVLLPVSAWLLLRRVPLWQVVLAPAAGVALGHALEWMLLSQTTFAGAAAGLGSAVLALAVVTGRQMRSLDGPGHPRDVTGASTEGAQLGAGVPHVETTGMMRVKRWLTRR